MNPANVSPFPAVDDASAGPRHLKLTTRSLLRALAVGIFSLIALVEISCIAPFVRREQRWLLRATWLSKWCRLACRVLGIHVNCPGAMPSAGLLVSNHLSYLDIIVFSALRPCLFVAKSDVARWFLFGWLARSAGTIFVDRKSKLRTREAVEQIRQALTSGALVVLFPEGTSSDGASVLPFHSSLLEPVVQLQGPVTTAAIDYSTSQGSVADEICYWRDMTLAPHLLNLFTKHAICSLVVVKPFTSRAENRKEFARQLRRQIIGMRS